VPTDPIDNHPDPGHRSPHESPTTITQNHRDQQRAFQCAAEEIAGGASQGAGDPASFGIEVGNLESWARDKGTLFPDAAFDLLPLVSNSPQQHECITMMKSTDLPPKTHLDLESLWSSVMPIRNPHFPALRSSPTAVSGATCQKQIPSSQRLFHSKTCPGKARRRQINSQQSIPLTIHNPNFSLLLFP